MNKRCKFLRDIYDGDELVFKKDCEYLVVYENSELYVFTGHVGIGKDSEGVNYIAIED